MNHKNVSSSTELQVSCISQIPKGFSGYVWIKNSYYCTYPDKEAPDGRFLYMLDSEYVQEQAEDNDTFYNNEYLGGGFI